MHWNERDDDKEGQEARVGFEIIGLMAATNAGVVGHNGALPWHYESELEHFRRTVFGEVMIMGRKTYESIPSGTRRSGTTIVLSRAAPSIQQPHQPRQPQPHQPHGATNGTTGNGMTADGTMDDTTTAGEVIFVNNLESCGEQLRRLSKNRAADGRKMQAFMVGGGQVASTFLEKNLISRFILTKINKPYQGDTYLPLHHLSNWRAEVIIEEEHYTVHSLINPSETSWNSLKV